MSRLDDLGEAAEKAGLSLRGVVVLNQTERTGPLKTARDVALLGFAGPRQWPAFAASPEAADGARHPLDRWSLRVVSELGARFGATPLFPFEGPPYWPFQSWAQSAEPVASSPLGLLVHPQYGLWHSYRGALAFDEALESPQHSDAPSPCLTCVDKPCLTACPVNAFSRRGYDVAACAGWLRRAEGVGCLSDGCLARRACPVGAEFTQTPEQAGFHMRAFLAARA